MSNLVSNLSQISLKRKKNETVLLKDLLDDSIVTKEMAVSISTKILICIILLLHGANPS